VIDYRKRQPPAAQYRTSANIYTHVRDEMLRKATVNLEEVFGSRGK
jgi:hypothetical protein